jgi:hypothetical protein
MSAIRSATPGVDLGGNALDGVGESLTLSRVEFNLVTMRAMPTGDLRHHACGECRILMNCRKPNKRCAGYNPIKQ